MLDLRALRDRGLATFFEVIGKLREVEIVPVQGARITKACRRIAVSGFLRRFG